MHFFMGFCNPLLKRPAEYFGLYIRFWSMTYSQKNVHFFTDNIVRKVSSGQICPRFLLTCLSSNFVDILSTKSRPFPFFFYRPFVEETWMRLSYVMLQDSLFSNVGEATIMTGCGKGVFRLFLYLEFHWYQLMCLSNFNASNSRWDLLLLFQ